MTAEVLDFSFINAVTIPEAFEASLWWRKSSLPTPLPREHACLRRLFLVSVVNYCHFH